MTFDVFHARNHDRDSRRKKSESLLLFGNPRAACYSNEPTTLSFHRLFPQQNFTRRIWISVSPEVSQTVGRGVQTQARVHEQSEVQFGTHDRD